MNSNEIHSAVLLGSHNAVRAFLAPLISQVAGIVGSEFSVSYDGCGRIQVLIEAGNKSTAETWKLIWAAAKAARVALPQSLKVSKPSRGTVDGGTFTITRDAFTVTVR